MPTAPLTSVRPSLSRLYVVRAAFALVWAGAVLALASELNPFIAALLVLYPVYDLVSVAVDAKTAGPGGASSTLRVNAAVSAVAAIALAVAATSGIPAVLRVWGAWAVVAGLAQLVVALRRRATGGQLPMILSGAISVLAGVGFALMASGDDPALNPLGGYALLGALFFLASAILLRRRGGQA